MSERPASSGRHTQRTGRRSGESGTREAILDAARTQFAERGYDGATIRGIAADAGVDPALVHHFYGTKERLFVAAVRFPVVPSEVLARVAEAGPEQLGTTFVRTVLGLWEASETREQSLALVRSAVTNECAVTMLRGFVESAIFRAIAGVVQDEDARFRASLVASQLLGLFVARMLLCLEPIASAGVDDVVAAVGPTVQRYLTGDVRAASAAGVRPGTRDPCRSAGKPR
ncbi:MAG: TetR family transcriptional regulator [Actinomycetota bacterium]